MRLNQRLLRFIGIVQTVLFAGHFLLYQTWMFASPSRHTPAALWTALVLAVLSISFVTASVLAFKYTNAFVRALYKVAAVWIGLLSFLFFACIAAWLVFLVSLPMRFALNFHRLVEYLFAAALLAGLAAVVNASLTRTTRIRIRLPNLPHSWRGRTAALVSDLHLGHVRNARFLRRMIAKITRQKPDAVFIAGDFYDGTAIDARRAAAPLRDLTAPHGVYFVAGNHEQFRDDRKYLHAIADTGVRVLNNEKVDADGLQILGVSYSSATRAGHLATTLHSLRVDRDRASILLTHAPDHPATAEAAGISLQLSGHTHLGQFIPWNWFARRVYRQFVYGLSRIGNLQVFTSSGAGTWGPPLRLGSNPEIVMLEFH
jgi:predicted MPP superfamily phosphohydrolase